MNKSFDQLLVAVWALLASGLGMAFYIGLNAQPTPGGGGLAIQATYAVFYVLFAGMLALRFRESFAIFMKEKWIVVLWLWALFSASWSLLPEVSLRRCIGLLGTILVGMFVATRFEPKTQIRIVAYCMGIAAAASLVACLLFPKYAIAPTGEWTGVFYQKNALGHPMALGVLSFTFLAFGQKKGRLALIFMAVFCGGMLLMSRSVTAMIVCVTMLLVLRFRKWLLLRTRRLVAIGAVFLTIAIPAGIYAIQHIDAILKVMGRDTTLTGRIPLWNVVLEEIAARPMLGYGYSSFWLSAEGARIQQNLGWQIIHAHNGYLEITLEIGLVGTALLLLGAAINIFRGVRVARDAEDVYEFWPLFYLLYALFDNVAESWFLVANSMLWMLFVANSYWIVRRYMEPVTEEDEGIEPLLDQMGEPVRP